MARERALLDRLRRPDPEAARSTRENPRVLAESVMANMRRLLNSRHGITPIAPDYGIPDLSEVLHNFADAISGMRKAIKTSIERYEPRLKRVSVKHVDSADDPMALHFEISGELVIDGEKASVHFETRMDGAGGVQVKG